MIFCNKAAPIRRDLRKNPDTLKGAQRDCDDAYAVSSLANGGGEGSLRDDEVVVFELRSQPHFDLAVELA